MAIGEKGYVDSYNVATSKRGSRVFLSWDARLEDTPRDPDDRFAALQIQRLKRGFLLVIRPGDRFGVRSLIWGEYAPVIELVQKKPQKAQRSSPGPQ